jgi:hypothetical protein
MHKNTNMDSFVCCGKNWDFYFAQKPSSTYADILYNVVLTSTYIPEKYIDRDYDTPWIYLQYA